MFHQHVLDPQQTSEPGRVDERGGREAGQPAMKSKGHSPRRHRLRLAVARGLVEKESRFFSAHYFFRADDQRSRKTRERSPRNFQSRRRPVLATLTGGAYSALVRGKDGGIGVALVEGFHLPSPPAGRSLGKPSP